MTFRIHTTNDVKYITLGTIVFLSILFLVMIWMTVSANDQVSMIAFLCSAAVMPLILLGGAIFAPTGYRVEDETLILNRPIKPIRIPVSNIETIEPVEKEYFRHSIRTWGSSGLFGFYGYFWSKKEGTFFAMTKSRQNLVLVVTKEGKKILTSPQSPQKFITACR